jgi:hypothetical protein
VGRKYARGTKAWFICSRCGQRGLYRQSVFDGYYPNLRVHQECWEDKHPQEKLLKMEDPIALYRPSPEWGGAPATLFASIDALTGFVTLTWTEAEVFNARFESYDVYRADVDPLTGVIGEYVLLEALPILYDEFMAILDQTLTYTDDTVLPLTTYAYKVIANAAN